MSGRTVKCAKLCRELPAMAARRSRPPGQRSSRASPGRLGRVAGFAADLLHRRRLNLGDPEGRKLSTRR